MKINLPVLDEEVILLPERAVFRPLNKTLYIADTHWGKAATFRTHHIPLPDGALKQDLQRLSQAINKTDATRVVVLGDLVHSEHSSADDVLDSVLQWRTNYPDLTIQLIKGNHDRKIENLIQQCNIETLLQPPIDDGLLLSHKPIEEQTHYVLCGHLHPTWTVRGGARQEINLPCFMQSKTVFILPAFTQFTGATTYKISQLEHVYVTTSTQVFQVL